MPRITFIDGPPGTGKTRRILAETHAAKGHVGVVTYTKAAAGVAKARGHKDLETGTVYSAAFTWPHVAPFADSGTMARRRSSAYQERKVHDEFDSALQVYGATAPSLQPKTIWDEMASQLHAWDGIGDPPFDLHEASAKGPLTYILPVARWLEAGAPIHDQDFVPYDTLYVDEAQDMSALELAAAAALVHPDGHLECSGDPGQAIFGHGKGITGRQLPPALAQAEEVQTLSKGWRCGHRLATLASRVLAPYWDRPASTFAADHDTFVFPWDAGTTPPHRGLVLGYSRAACIGQFERWGLSQTWVVPGPADPDKELIVCTGHAAKGSEADEVYLLPWGKDGLDALCEGDPAHLRLLYVMLTRARKRIYINPLLLECC